MPYSESQKRASRKYNDEKYERVGLYLKNGERDKWRERAQAEGISLSEFIKRCVAKELER